MLSFLSFLPIPVLRILEIEANMFYDRNHQMYEAALLTRCYTQHALRPFIDSEINHNTKDIEISFTKRTNLLHHLYLIISKILSRLGIAQQLQI